MTSEPSNDSVFQSDGSSAQYRLYFLDGIGTITARAYEFEAARDELALEVAESWLEGRSAELWSGPRKIKTWRPNPLPFPLA
jgi:hypothetical protein